MDSTQPGCTILHGSVKGFANPLQKKMEQVRGGSNGLACSSQRQLDKALQGNSKTSPRQRTLSTLAAEHTTIIYQQFVAWQRIKNGLAGKNANISKKDALEIIAACTTVQQFFAHSPEDYRFLVALTRRLGARARVS
jgi:hypothetical protein